MTRRRAARSMSTSSRSPRLRVRPPRGIDDSFAMRAVRGSGRRSRAASREVAGCDAVTRAAAPHGRRVNLAERPGPRHGRRGIFVWLIPG
ncbi:hypothetical protein AQ476_16270 [Burkholderia thailandensis]|nr:hypothetical protein AQ476_16270 [Burkholderia thailandensis]PNE73714.1 hypothetical protein A8H37_17305 [Burkholderia thailandensis]